MRAELHPETAKGAAQAAGMNESIGRGRQLGAVPRHPLNLRDNTEEKRASVTDHIKKLDYTPADVTSYFFEKDWDRAWRMLQRTQ
jgi:hypothetical protein